MIDYEKIRPDLRTGDKVLFRGGGIPSTAILWFCSIFRGFKFTRWSHIGHIIIDSDRVLLSESTTLIAGKESNDPNTIQFKGVRLVPFSEVIKIYKGQIGIRRLFCTRTPEMLHKSQLYTAKHLGKKYEKHLIELVGSAIDGVDWYKKTNNTYLFCSEYTAGLDIEWDLLDPPANEYTPDDYGIGGYVDNNLKHSARLGEVLRIK